MTPAFDKFGLGGADIITTNRSLDKNFDVLKGFLTNLGQYSGIATTGVAMTSTVFKTVASLDLPAGTWDVSGTIDYQTAAGTLVTAVVAAISLVDNAVPGTAEAQTQIVTNFTASQRQIIATPVVNTVLAGLTTVYLVGYASFTVSTVSCTAFLRARRVA